MFWSFLVLQDFLTHSGRSTSWKLLCIHLEAAGRAKKASFTDKCPTISLDAAQLAYHGWWVLEGRLIATNEPPAAFLRDPGHGDSMRFIGSSEVLISSYHTNWILCSIKLLWISSLSLSLDFLCPRSVLLSTDSASP